MTILKAWVLYLAVLVLSLAGLVYVAINDPDRVEHEYTMKVLRIIQEDHKSSTNYRGVFELQSGKVVDFSVNASVFVRYQPGDNISFNLTNRELGQSTGNYDAYFVILIIWTFLFGFVGAAFISESLPNILKKNKD